MHLSQLIVKLWVVGKWGNISLSLSYSCIIYTCFWCGFICQHVVEMGGSTRFGRYATVVLLIYRVNHICVYISFFPLQLLLLEFNKFILTRIQFCIDMWLFIDIRRKENAPRVDDSQFLLYLLLYYWFHNSIQFSLSPVFNVHLLATVCKWWFEKYI